MIKILATSRDGNEVKVPAEPTGSLMQVLRDIPELNVRADCGGNAACATCHVFIRSDWTTVVGPPLSDDEVDMLDGLLSTTAQSRLACQVQLEPALDGMAVTVAPEE